MNEREVFIAALQKESPRQRQEYLDEACGGDESLRQRVEALLGAHDRVGSFLQEPALCHIGAAVDERNHPVSTQLVTDAYQEKDTTQLEETASRVGSVQEKLTETQVEAACPEPPSLEFLIPPRELDELGRLGHYRVLRLLGYGGMGMVFLADDTRLQRQVALKVMRPELAANPAGRQRFLREGRVAAQIRSDHVVNIYHVDQEGDLPYLVMEVLRGQSLADALEQKHSLPLALCLKIARETAEGLAAAHASGLIHRDIKPGNIWLEEPNGRVKLLDFGLARARTGPLITQHHVILGTPAYMSPEQATGQPLDDRCDLFSLGAVFYHMLTGQRPFPGDDLLTVLSNLVNATTRPAAGLVPGLPASVADLLDRLMAKDRAGRPASAAEVARALLAIEQEAVRLASSPDQATLSARAETDSITRRPDVPPVRSRRRLALVGGLGLASLTIGLLVAVLAGAFRDRADDDLTPTDLIKTDQPNDLASSKSIKTDQSNDLASSKSIKTDRLEPPPIREFTLSAHPYGQIETVAFTADSKTLVSADFGGEVIYWDMERREKPFPMWAVPSRQLQTIAVDPQRRWLAVGEVGPDIRLFRFGESVAAGLLKGHTDRVLQLAFLKDGRTLVSTGYDGSIRRWDVETQKEGQLLRPPGPRIDSLAVWEDGQGGLRLAFARHSTGGGSIALDDWEVEHVTSTPDRVALSPDGTRLVCTAGGNGNGVVLWDVPGKTRLGYLPGATFPRALAFTPDGKHIVATGVESTRIYRVDGGKLVARIDHPEKAVYGSLAVSPDGRWLAVGTLKGAVRIWHLPSLLLPPTD